MYRGAGWVAMTDRICLTLGFPIGGRKSCEKEAALRCEVVQDEAKTVGFKRLSLAPKPESLSDWGEQLVGPGDRSKTRSRQGCFVEE
jgi:hypothetical protein